MAASREQIEHFIFQNWMFRRRSGQRKWLKKQMNKWIRRNKFKMPEKGRFRQYSGYEY